LKQENLKEEEQVGEKKKRTLKKQAKNEMYRF
jgi:hypothetical protein